MSILRDTAMELKVDVLHITETHDHLEELSTPTDKWSCHHSEPGIKSQGAATFTRLDVKEASSTTNVSLGREKSEVMNFFSSGFCHFIEVEEFYS